MNIDFSMSREDWIALIREFFEIIQNFFKEIGINLFKESEEGESTTSPSEP